MAKVTTRLAKRSKSAVRKGYEKVESSVMAAVGRRTVKGKMQNAKFVAGRAAKGALIAGGVAAAGVLVSEVRKRRKPV
ncbi:MAG TPA: hypothetical protein VF737_10185 [Gemmatimonadaceae bacterium]